MSNTDSRYLSRTELIHFGLLVSNAMLYSIDSNINRLDSLHTQYTTLCSVDSRYLNQGWFTTYTISNRSLYSVDGRLFKRQGWLTMVSSLDSMLPCLSFLVCVFVCFFLPSLFFLTYSESYSSVDPHGRPKFSIEAHDPTYTPFQSKKL